MAGDIPAWVSPFLRYIRIMGLAGNVRKVFKNNELYGKSSGIRNLGCQRALKMVLGQLRGPSLWADDTSKLPQSDLYRHARRVLCQWISITGGCDERGNVPSVRRAYPGFVCPRI